MNRIFAAADILLPKRSCFPEWSVIACDQFTSEPEYWERVKAIVGEKPSALNLVLPEAWLSISGEDKISAINRNMKIYLESGIFDIYKDAYIYVERTLFDGSIRQGIVGMIDLAAYDFSQDARSPIRATERTVVSRIPPRKKVRENALLELPHVLLLADDADCSMIEPMAGKKNELECLYDFDLMEGGGHIRGYLIAGEAKKSFCESLKAYEEGKLDSGSEKAPLLYAVGDGNHSLATAKACYEDIKNRIGEDAAKSHPARFAMVELENIHSPALSFEAIHRIVKNTDADALIKAIKKLPWVCEDSPCRIEYFTGKEHGSFGVDMSFKILPVALLQEFLDEFLPDADDIDYIHGEETLKRLAAADGCAGFILPSIQKSGLFGGIEQGGVLPRKTFSMGHAREKRYYLEARQIQKA